MNMSVDTSKKSLLRQIAEQSGVSVSTASIVLNGRGDQMRISKATQQRVQEVAKQADYTPNVYARKLRKSAKGESSKVVGVFWSTEFLNESMGEFFYQANSTMMENHYQIEFSIRFFVPGQLKDVQDQLNPWQFNALIFCGSNDEDIAFLETLGLDIPIVMSSNPRSNTLSSVSVDNIDVGKRGVQELMSHGYRRLGIIDQDQHTLGSSIRHFSFRSEALSSGADVRAEWCLDVDNTDFSATYAQIQNVLSQDEHPDAFFVTNNTISLNTAIAINAWKQRTGKDCALLLCGVDERLNVLVSNKAFLDFGLGKFAAASVRLVWLLMNGELKAPVKWMIAAEVDASDLTTLDP